MEGKEEDVKLGANKFSERQPIGTSAQTDKDYKEPPPAPLFEPGELKSWSFYRAGIAEFVATFLFLYITVLTVMGVSQSKTKCATVGIQGIAWAFGGMIFALVYCTAGISGGHINPAVTFGLLLARKLSLTRAVFYIIMQCLGAICGAGVVKGFQGDSRYEMLGGGANVVNHGYTKGDGLGAEIIGTFVLVYTVFSATDAKRNARDSHVPTTLDMAEGITTRLQKEFAQFQKDMEKIDSKLDDKVEKLGERLHNTLSVDLNNALANVNTEISAIKQFLPKLMEAVTGKKAADIGELSFVENVPKSMSDNLIVGNSSRGTGPLLQEPGNLVDILDPSRCNARRSKLECPRFDGYDFLGWYMKVEQYFEAVRTVEEEKIQTVMIHLDGRALQWHQRVIKTKGNVKELKWGDYVADMRSRFHSDEFTDPMAELVSLKQTATVEEYYEEFEALLNLLQLSEAYALSIFVSNLKPEISKSVKLFHPKSVTYALNLAKQMEEIMYNPPKKLFLPYHRPTPTSSTFPNTHTPAKHYTPSDPKTLPGLLPTPKTHITPYTTQTRPYNPSTARTVYTKPENNSNKSYRNPTREEKDERRRKGLCMWCGLKFTQGHQCIRSQLYQLLVDDAVHNEGESEEFLDCIESTEESNQFEEKDSPVISLHALWGTEGCQTMRVLGKIKKQSVVMLIDSGSTHNFIDQNIAKRLKCQTYSIEQVSVTVANGDTMKIQEGCKKIQWESQGLVQNTDFLLISLRGCDLVLGVQWLQTLGPIIWDFSALSMQFRNNDKMVILRGMQGGTVHFASKNQLSKLAACRSTATLLVTEKSPLELMSVHSQYEADGFSAMQLQELLQQYGQLFDEPRGLPPRRNHDHHIPLKDSNQVVKMRPYRYSTIQKDEIEKLVAEMKSTGIIRDSSSPFASPVVLVKKKDGTWRLCIDYRQLNKLTIKDTFPIPLVEELLDELSGSSWFTKLDLKAGYHQIRMQEEDVHKTAFRTHQGHYEFLVMPFGLTNAPATFQSLMNHIFQPFLRKFVLVFFDDILVYSDTWHTHMQHLSLVFDLLFQHQLYLKLSKCELGASQVEYLGHIISKEGVAMDRKKISAMLEWPTPITVKDLRGFLGLTGYYRRFIQGYGTIAKPLTELLKKGSFSWTDKAQTAFEQLKHAMVSAPVLALPNFDVMFVVESDASNDGIGAVLSQKGRPVAYFSKGLGPRHQLLSVYEREMMAILAAVKKWHSYLIGRHFQIRTDHYSLKFLLDHKATTPAQQVWVVKMMGYDYEVIYRKGSTNTVADALSRRPQGSLCAISIVTSDVLQKIKQSWSTDASLVALIHKLETSPPKVSKYSWNHGQLRRKDRLVIGQDEELRRTLFQLFHSTPEGGHSGAEVTMKRLTAVCYWKGLKKDVREMVRNCIVCQQCKYDTSAAPGLLQPLPIPDKIWTDISMDFLEGLPLVKGKSVILVVVDRLSKYAHFISLSHPYTAMTIAKIFLDNIYKLHGLPNSIVSDRDKIFVSKFWQELFKLLGTKLNLSTSYHPQTDGQTEVVNRCLQTYLRCMTSERPRDWINWLSLAEWWYNTSYHTAIHTTPYAVVYGQPAPSHLHYIAGNSKVEAVDRSLKTREAAIKMIKFYLQRAQNRMRQQANKKRSDRSFEVGDLVYIKLQPYRQTTIANRKCLKLSARYFGPYPVLDKVGLVAYKLALPATSKVHPVFHVSQLKKHVGPCDSQSQLPLLDEVGVIMKEPISIIDRRISKRGNQAVTEVLVQWRNTFPEDATWEILSSFQQQFPDFHH